MLILTRKPNTSICINNTEINIQVLDIAKNSVRLGITAPDGVTVHRNEIQKRINEEKLKEKKLDAY